MTRITRILVPTDFSATSDDALAYAKVLAGPLGASLHVLHAFEDPFTTTAFAAEVYAPLPLTMRDELIRGAEERLAERLTAEERTRFQGTAEILGGPPAQTIVQYAGSMGADLIVMGTHGRGGMAHLLLGSVAERVVRTAPCAVLTLREARARAIRRVLVPTDFSHTSDAALDYAFLAGATFGASIQLLHVIDDPFITEGLAAEAYMTEAPALRSAMLRDARARLARRAAVRPALPPLTVDTEVLFGHGAKTIGEYAAMRDVDLIVMGTHGRTGVAHLLLGSVAERLVRTAACPVLTVRAAAVPQPHAEAAYEMQPVAGDL